MFSRGRTSKWRPRWEEGNLQLPSPRAAPGAHWLRILFDWAMFVSMGSTSSLDRPFTKSASKPNSGGIRGRAAPGSKHLLFVAGHLPTRHCNVKTSGWPLSRVSHRSGALAKANKPPTCHTFESSNRARRVSNIGVVWSTSLDQMSGSNFFFKFLSLKPQRGISFIGASLLPGASFFPFFRVCILSGTSIFRLEFIV